MQSWEFRPDKCECFGGYCFRRFHCNKGTGKRKAKVVDKPVIKEAPPEQEAYLFYSAKPDDLRFWERVWHPKEG